MLSNEDIILEIRRSRVFFSNQFSLVHVFGNVNSDVLEGLYISILTHVSADKV